MRFGGAVLRVSYRAKIGRHDVGRKKFGRRPIVDLLVALYV